MTEATAPPATEESAATPDPALIEPGFFPGVTHTEMHAWPGECSPSSLKTLARSPLHFRHERDHGGPDQTDPMKLGNAFHEAVLEYDGWDERWAVPPLDAAGKTLQKRGKPNLERWAEWEEAHPTAQTLTERQHREILGMRDSILTDPRTSACLETVKRRNIELGMRWQDESGEWIKTRLDAYGTYKNLPCIFELKSTENAKSGPFGAQIRNLLYDMAAACQLHGFRSLEAPEQRRRLFVFIVCEKSPPYACTTYEMDEELIDQGYRTFRRLMNTYVACKAAKSWPSYPADLIELRQARRWEDSGDF